MPLRRIRVLNVSYPMIYVVIHFCPNHLSPDFRSNCDLYVYEPEGERAEVQGKINKIVCYKTLYMYVLS